MSSSNIPLAFCEWVRVEEMIGGSKAMPSERRTYRPRFWRDRLWIGVILAVLGLPFMLLGLLMVCLVIAQWTTALVSLGGQVHLAVFLLLAALIYALGHFLFYIFWCLLKSEVVFAPDYLIYSRPSVLLFSRSEVKVRMRSIGSVVLGQVAMSHIAPSALNTVLARASAISNIGVEIGYESGDRIRMLSLPVMNDAEYFSEIGGLIVNLHLIPTKAPFIFMRADWGRLPHRPWIERIASYLEIGFFISSIVILILELT